MTRLPLIVGFGGYNAAGRGSFHHAYRRTVLDSLEPEKQVSTLLGLACLMKLVRHEDGHYVDSDDKVLSAEQVAEKYRETIVKNTLIRRIDKSYFDVDRVSSFKNVELASAEQSKFSLRRRHLPKPLPDNWVVFEIDEKTVQVVIDGELSIRMENFRESEVKAAGQLPLGFDPGAHYNSHFHPRGLQMTVLAASDAINSVGIPWQTICDSVKPDQIGVYASSAAGQADENGLGGLLQARLKSGRVTSKQLALGLNSMPTDFVNAYVCGSVGATGSVVGACASFLYNLRIAVDDIVARRRRVVIVGGTEAVITPEIIEGFSAMGALATDERLTKLDDVDTPDYARYSRPFGENCGFTVGEGAQYCVLMDDQLALELGADIHGAVHDVFLNADGFKKSISSPGVGNYLTMAKAVAAASSIVGEEAVRERSFIQAHGSSTPRNRVTESMVFDKVATAFGIENWPVTAVKAFVGHTLAPASGDQLVSALGVFADGVLPGIKTIDKVADDVFDDHLEIIVDDKKVEMDVAFLNSKGFGGNNATASLLSPKLTEEMLAKRYGVDKMTEYQQKRQATRAQAKEYDRQATNGDLNVIYNFGESMINEAEIQIDKDKLMMSEFKLAVDLDLDNPYKDMT